MRSVITGVALLVVAAAIAVLPASAAYATPSIEVDQDSGTVRVRADETVPATPVGPAQSPGTRVVGSTTIQVGAPSSPTGQWCATTAGFGACASHQGDGYLASLGVRPGVCAWGVTPTAASDPNCVNGRSCVVAATANLLCRP